MILQASIKAIILISPPHFEQYVECYNMGHIRGSTSYIFCISRAQDLLRPRDFHLLLYGIRVQYPFFSACLLLRYYRSHITRLSVLPCPVYGIQVISIVLRDSGYDLMELIYNDMLEHNEDYPLDLKGRNEPVKYLDFRHVFFQEQFFKRHALGLDNEFIIDNEDNPVQWQPGDIVYFQFDPDNPDQDLGGFISSRSNDNGVPLVIMISKDFGKVSEVDVLYEYNVVGHYRYPNPYEEIE